MNTKHTPGPWVAEMRYINDIPGNARVEVMAWSKHEDHMNSAVASVCYSHTPCRFYIDDKDEAEANARLGQSCAMGQAQEQRRGAGREADESGDWHVHAGADG